MIRLSPIHALVAAAAVSACAGSGGTTSPGPRRTVALSLSVPAPRAATLPPGLQISTVRLVVGDVSLGGGDQFGCVDCQNNDTGEHRTSPALVTLAAGSGPVQVGTDEVQPGTFQAAEIDIVRPATPLIGATTDTTIELSGSLNGKAFTIGIPATGTFVQPLSPPLQVGATPSGAISVKVDLPIATWFAGYAGTTLDPSDPVQRAQIVANVQRFLAAGAAEEARSESGGRED